MAYINTSVAYSWGFS